MATAQLAVPLFCVQTCPRARSDPTLARVRLDLALNLPVGIAKKPSAVIDNVAADQPRMDDLGSPRQVHIPHHLPKNVHSPPRFDVNIAVDCAAEVELTAVQHANIPEDASPEGKCLVDRHIAAERAFFISHRSANLPGKTAAAMLDASRLPTYLSVLTPPARLSRINRRPTIEPRQTHTRQRAQQAKALAIQLARLATDTRCSNVVVLDVRRISPITDFLIIATGTSPRQMRSVADELIEAAEAAGYPAVATSGYEGSQWICIDFIDVVLHVFTGDARMFYDLENLWSDAPKVTWEPDA